MERKEQVLILAGSKNDLKIMENAAKMLDELGIRYAVRVSSAHRTPDDLVRVVEEYTGMGVKVIIAAAGLANHLAGAVASRTLRPVIGVPLARPPLSGMDSLLSTVQMPPGVPVATVGIDRAENAAILAAEILALSDSRIEKKLAGHREKMRKSVLSE